jgi:hypothetical protein
MWKERRTRPPSSSWTGWVAAGMPRRR